MVSCSGRSPHDIVYGALAYLSVSLAFAVWPVGVQAAPSNKTFDRAISLSELQSRFKACRESPACPEILFNFGGLTAIGGVAISVAAKDIVVFGTHDASQPPIMTEDFVIALRNVADRGGAPACTINPDPVVFEQLSPAYESGGYAAWVKLCTEQQTVGVFNVPLESRFSRQMVTADYLLKDIVSGKVDAGIESLTDTRLNEAARRVSTGHQPQIPVGLDRFELVAGPAAYVQHPGGELVYMEYVDVSLVTERQRVQASRQFLGQGQADPFALKFAERFSQAYSDISERHPIYHELKNLYALVALAQLIDLINAQTRSGLSLDYFKKKFIVPEAKNPSHVKGKSHVKNTSVDVLDGRVALALPSCGGVSMDMRVGPQSRKDRSGTTDEILRNIVAGRPSSRSVAWSFAKPVTIFIER